MGEQLRLPLDWPPATAEHSLTTSVDTVLTAWSADPAVGPSTTQRFTRVLGRFARYAAASGVTTLAGVDHDLPAAFVAARHRARDQTITAPTVTTRRARAAALRAFFSTAVRLGLTLDDPTAQLPVARPGWGRAVSVRPLTDDEAALVRLYTQRARPTRHAATVALLLAGAHTGEAGHITTADLDPGAGAVRVHGSGRFRSRTLRLDGFARHVLTARADHLTQQHTTVNGGQSPPVLCASSLGTSASRQATVCATVRGVLTRAGLSGDPALRPSSLTGYAARRVFDRTGHIEAAAELLGAASLDATVTLVGHHWRHPR